MNKNGKTPDFREVEPLLRNGYELIRLGEKSKKPLEGGWPRLAPLTEAEARAHMESGGNLGVRPRPVDFILDVDPRNGGLGSLQKLEQLIGVSLVVSNPCVNTPSGGFHIYMLKPAGVEIENKLPGFPGLDFKCVQYVAPGSVHPDYLNGPLYYWDLVSPELPARLAPQALIDLITKKANSRTNTSSEVPEWTPEMLKEALEQLKVTEFREEDKWRQLMMAAHEATGGEGEDVFVEWSRSDGLYAGDGPEIRKRWDSLKFGKNGNAGIGTLIKILLEHGVTDIPTNPAADFEGMGDENNGLPTIKVSGGSLPANVRDAEIYQAAATYRQPDKGVFKRGNVLVTIARAAAPTKGPIRQAAGALQIVTMRRLEILRRKIMEAARWVRYDGRSKGFVQTDAPKDVASTLLESHDIWDNTPTLTGIIEAPTLRTDGSVLYQPGYDKATGLYFDPGDACFPEIPQNPTKAEAEAALNLLLEIVAEFPFTDEASRSVAIAYLITPLIRHVLRAAPMTVFRAPRPSSGKTLLATLAGYIATGLPPSLLTQPKSLEEEKKLIMSILLEGSQVTVIDNCELPLRGETLCIVLTEPVYRDRILGFSRTVTVPTTTTWAATGNNIVIEGDLSSRTLLCSLDPGTDRPGERRFKLNLHEQVPRRRGQLVAAALTIVRAYHVAGSPLKGKLKPFARFEDWSSLVREPLVWLGMVDPCDSRKAIEAEDPVGTQLGNLLEEWSKAFGKKPRTAADVIKFVTDPVNESDALFNAIQGVAEDHRGQLKSRKLGEYLKHYERRIERGLCFRKMGEYQGTSLWSCE